MKSKCHSPRCFPPKTSARKSDSRSCPRSNSAFAVTRSARRFRITTRSAATAPVARISARNDGPSVDDLTKTGTRDAREDWDSAGHSTDRWKFHRHADQTSKCRVPDSAGSKREPDQRVPATEADMPSTRVAESLRATRADVTCSGPLSPRISACTPCISAVPLTAGPGKPDHTPATCKSNFVEPVAEGRVAGMPTTRANCIRRRTSASPFTKGCSRLARSSPE